MSFFDYFARSPFSDGVEPHYTPSIRAERLVVVGRIALAVASLAAVWLDPSAPSRYAELAYTLLALYALYSVVLAVGMWKPARSLGWRLVTHVIDLGVFTAVIYMTEGATSPFFLYFIFSLLSATLRFRLRGTFWTAVAALLIFLGIGIWTSLVLDDPDFELNRFLVRSVYLSIAGVLLIYLSVHQEQHRHELWRLSDWPRGLPESLPVLLSGLLRHAAATMRTSRAALSSDREDGTVLMWVDGSESGTERFTDSLVASDLEDLDFYCRDVDASTPLVIAMTEGGAVEMRVHPLSEAVRSRFRPSGVLSVGLAGKRALGRLLFFDTPDVTSDDMVLCRIVGETIATRIDEFLLLQEVRNAAVFDERIRVSRELHDGVLQSLTGISLQLKVVERVLAAEPARAITILGQVRDLIVQNQRELRDFVQSLRDQETTSEEVPLSLKLMATAERARIEWSMKVALEIEAEEEIPRDVARQVSPLVNEAISNAGRHGGADSVQVSVHASRDQLAIRISDNGRGFPFEGRYDLRELESMKIGPLTLRERVLELEGELILESIANVGATIDIVIPLGASTVAEV